MPTSLNRLEQRSMGELLYLLDWYNQNPSYKSSKPLVLVGGWAVYAYNPYYGSVDIDLVTSSRFRKRVLHEARLAREFEKLGDRDVGTERVALKTEDGEVIVDLATFSEPNVF